MLCLHFNFYVFLTSFIIIYLNAIYLWYFKLCVFNWYTMCKVARKSLYMWRYSIVILITLRVICPKCPHAHHHYACSSITSLMAIGLNTCRLKTIFVWSCVPFYSKSSFLFQVPFYSKTSLQVYQTDALPDTHSHRIK